MRDFIEVTNPQTGEIVGKAEKTDAREMAQMVDDAYDAVNEWGMMPVYKRGEYLLKLADLIERDTEKIATLLSQEMGKPITGTRTECFDATVLLRAATERAKHLYGETLTSNSPGCDTDLVMTIREPLGVIAAIIPFNFPFELTFQKIAPALIMGNTVIVKAPTVCPLAVMSLQKLADEAGFPKGVCKFVACDRNVMNEQILDNTKVAGVTMTGSTAAGKKLAERGANTLTRMFLELGGNDAMILFDDCDVDKAIEEMVGTRAENNGQVCCSPKRFIVHESIYDEVTDKLIQALSALKVGSALDEEAMVTSLVSETEAIGVEENVNHTIEQGAVKKFGGERDGARYTPVVLTEVTPDMDIAQDLEIFGPVFPLIRFKDEEDAIRIANNTLYGLSSGLMTKDMNRAFRVGRQLQAGAAVLNGSGSYRHHDQPFGGYKQSGLGREGTSISLEEFSSIKVLVVKEAFAK